MFFLLYVFFIIKKINFVDYKLDLKLILEDDKSCERGSVEKDNNDEFKCVKFGILIVLLSGFSWKILVWVCIKYDVFLVYVVIVFSFLLFLMGLLILYYFLGKV